ncbi:MAG: hypothetical protein RIT02_3645, partial [Planctomycetota bacterium]
GTDLRITAGGNVDVESAASAAGLTTRSRPLVSTVPQTVYVVTGYTQVALGTILVPEVRMVTSTVTRQVGMEEFKIGTVDYTMDVRLTQDGYYNPRAAGNAKLREYFIEGLDYYNSTDYPHSLTSGVPVINWSTFGAAAVTSDYRSGNYRTWSQLSDTQRQAVLTTLGYLPLYNFSYSNGISRRTIDGVPSQQAWTPDWAGAPNVIEFIPVSGLNDKYIRMPKGAAADVLRVVSTGTPVVGTETVGSYRDQAVTRYTQDRSATRDEFGSVYEPLPNPGENLQKQLVKDDDGSPARWSIDYFAAGRRFYTVSDGRNDSGMLRNPTWSWQSTARENSVSDTPTGPAASVPGTYGTARNVSVPTGYRTAIASVTDVTEVNSRSMPAGQNLVYTPRSYAFAPYQTSIHQHQNDARAVGGFLAEPRTEQQLSAAAFAIPSGNGGYIGLYVRNGGIAGLTNGEPVNLWKFAPGQPSGDGVYIEMGTAGSWNDLSDEHVRFAVRQFDPKSVYTQRYETFRDYNATWTSISTDITDTRLTLDYAWTTNTHELYGKRDRFETVPVNVTVAGERSVTRWGAQPIREARTSLVASRTSDTQPVASSAFAANALSAAGSILLHAGGSAALSGRLIADTGTLTVDALQSISVDGAVAPGLDAALTEPALAVLQSPQTLTLRAGSLLHLGERSLLQTVVATESAPAEICLVSDADMQLSGSLDSSGDIEIVAGEDLLLDGVINAAASISATAGNGTAESGDLAATAFADLIANSTSGRITLASGALAGDMPLASATLLAGQEILLTSPRGTIGHGPGGYLESPLLNATAMAGVTAWTKSPDVQVQSTAAGNIEILSLGDVRVEAETADGSIDITARGNLHAALVATHGTSSDSHVRLRAQSGNDTQAALTLGLLTVAPIADLLLTADGPVTWDADLVPEPPVLHSGSLTIEGTSLPVLRVHTTSVVAHVLEAGNLELTREGTGDLTLSASIRNGSLNVTNPGGALELASLQLHTNADTSDVIATAARDISVGSISAGQFYLDAADIPQEYTGSSVGIHSLGDIRLTSGGRIFQHTSDAAVDLIADQLELQADNGIGLLQTAVNEVVATTTSGSISLADSDSVEETVPGLAAATLLAPAGSVTLHAAGTIILDQLTATGSAGAAEVISSGGSLRVRPGTDTPAVNITRAIDFRAADTLRLPAFYTAPDLIAYRADEVFFNDQTGSDGIGDGSGIPTTLEADTIILEQRGGLMLKGLTSITASRLELLSDTNVFLSEIDQITATDFVIQASGLRTVTAQVYDP